MSPMLKPAGHPVFDSPMMNEGFDRGAFERNYAVRGMSQEQQHELALMLMERDLGYHVYRLYARGNNTPRNAWEFPLKIPSELQAIVDEKRYAIFIALLNEAMAWRENALSEFVRFVCNALFYPCCRKLYDARRQKTIVKARECVFEYDHTMMRGHKARALMNTIKIGCDNGNTTCYMDILYVEVMPIPPPLRLGKPALPLALVFSGDGSWDSPFRLDPMDVLVASVPNISMLSKFIDTNWSSFLISLNTALRTVLPEDIDGTIHQTLDVLEGIELDDLGGLRLRLAKFFPSGVMRLGLMIDTFQPKKDAMLHDGASLPTTAVASKQTAVAKPNQDRSVRASHIPEPLVSERHSGRRARSIRELMLADESEEDDSMFLAANTNVEYSDNLDFRDSTNKKKEFMDKISTSSTATDGSQNGGFWRPRSGSKGRDNRATEIYSGMGKETVDCPDDVGKGWVYDGLPFVLRNSSRSGLERCYRSLIFLGRLPLWRAMPAQTSRGRAWFRWTLVLLLLCDTITTAFLILNFWCIQINPSSNPDSGCSRLGLVGFLSMYPFASITSPLLGITATAFSLPKWARRFAEWNGLSMCNVLVALGMYSHYQQYLDISSLICPAALLFLKFLEGVFNAKKFGLFGKWKVQ